MAIKYLPGFLCNLIGSIYKCKNLAFYKDNQYVNIQFKFVLDRDAYVGKLKY